MSDLVDFLKQGTLPFVGREVETQRIVDFWRGVFEARGLRAMMMFGEAGIGKSRLLEHAIRSIIESRGSVVHVKIYSEKSLFPLVAQALSHRDAGGMLSMEEPDATLGSIGSAMQRLARLRPTLLVLEDLHLLGAESLPNLVGLLELLADETISVLALARPVELAARGALEPYLIEEFTLRGLRREDCVTIWESVSGALLPRDVADALHGLTAGSPMALRLALREAFGQRDVRMNGANVLPAAASAEALARTMRRSVESFATGMMTHLTQEELQGAKCLASLGEVFSREAAAVLLDGDTWLIDALLIKGIIAPAVAPPEPLPESPSTTTPLGFTHTLLHRQLIDGVGLDAEPLIHVVADFPLYSVLPFRLLSERVWSAPSLECEIVERAFYRTIRVQVALIQGSQWQHADHTWGTAMRLLTLRMGGWKRAEWEEMLVRLVHHKLSMLRREPVPVRLPWLHYLESLTADASTDELVVGQIRALFHRDLMYSEGDAEISGRLWDRAEHLTATRVHLRKTIAYADYVFAACVGAQGQGNRALLRRIEERTDQLLGLPDLPERVRRIYEQHVRGTLLTLYENQEELRARLDRIAELERTVPIDNLNVWTFCVDFLAEVASLDALNRICDGIIPEIRKQGMIDLLVDTVAIQQYVLAGISDSLDESLSAVERALGEMSAWRRAQVESLIGMRMIDATLLGPEPQRAPEIIKDYGIDETRLSTIQRLALALLTDDPLPRLRDLRDGRDKSNDLMPLLDYLLGDDDRGHQAVRELLAVPPLRLVDILRLRSVARAIELVQEKRKGRGTSALRGDIAEALTRALEWLDAPERGLYAYMKPLLHQIRPHISARAAAGWEKKIEKRAEALRGRHVPSATRPLRLSMLGAITATMLDGTQQRFQGARARTLLATMVINQMMKEPLSPADFCRQAAGGETVDIENARAVVRTTVHRVREAIGYDAIVTEDGAPPRLNPQLVRVDLLEAHALLKRAEHLRSSSPMQASVAFRDALDITRGEVLFPSLYDDFIEAARESFEALLRTTAIGVAGALAREGGADDAATVLSRAVAALPGDENLAERLGDMLRRAGKHVEAVRAVRRASGE
jgi:hypothetical protein